MLLLMFPKALILYLGTSGAKPRDYPCSYSFLQIHLYRNVTVRFYLCFTRQLRWFCEKKLTKKIILYCDYEALKVVRIYRCHPVYERHSSDSEGNCPLPNFYIKVVLRIHEILVFLLDDRRIRISISD
jgi:hypothetical protein